MPIYIGRPMPSRKRPDCSRPLPQALVIPEVMTLRTLADVRERIGHLPKETRAKDLANRRDRARRRCAWRRCC
jgi:hypothetical protein